ncbi:trans-aconitate 2-methyltransferase [Yoonia sp. R2331]|uniref:class I SAM-dependent methyltransferase n=1 Tax=Yoonia sp. R2331 TaxID=3237238 RepID=UPI0034E40FB3
MAKPSAFFTLHRDLPREGPGLPADIAWVADHAHVPKGGRILDGACGPGADIGTLLDTFAPATLIGVDWQAHFAAEGAATFADDPRVTVTQGDMFAQPGPFDLIWCAGAIYFAGITQSLQNWNAALAPGGTIAFTTPAYFTDTPSATAQAMWAGEGETPNRRQITQQITAAGFRLTASRPLTDAAWHAYYDPMMARIAKLRPGADTALIKVLDEGAQELTDWQAAKDETGYELCVVTRA